MAPLLAVLALLGIGTGSAARAAATLSPALKLKPALGDIEAGRKGPAQMEAPLPVDDGARDAAADRKRDELIADLQKIIPKVQAGPRKADLLFQLAEYWWEKSRFVGLQEVKDYDDAFATWQAARDQKGEKEAGAEPKISTKKSDACRKQALEVYQSVLKDYPGYPRNDEVLFVVAYNLYESGDKLEALKSYDTLIRQYPASRFVPDAFVQMGEHYFAANDLARARAAFERAANDKTPKIYSFALYKLAWCDYNAGDYSAAIDKFKKVIAYAEQQAAQAAPAQRDRIQLKNESLRDVVLAFAQLDAIDSAIAFLEDKGGAHSLDYINKLAATYFDSGKFDQAIRVYRLLEDAAPAHLRAPAWQQKILLAYDKLSKRDKVILEMKRLVRDYGPSSAWAKANAGQKGALAEAADLAESALRELVQDYHQEAIRTKSVATYRLARDIYRQYLETFPESDSAYRLRFYYAEILYALEDWAPAAEQYDRVVTLDPKGPSAQRAAYNQILALEKQVAIGKGLAKKRELADEMRIDDRRAKGQVEQQRTVRIEKVARDTAAEPIPEPEAKLIASCERYLAVSPRAKDEIVIRYKAAFVYYDHRQYLEAARRFSEIILRWPNDLWSQKAADLSMNILEVKEEWLALSELAQKLHDDKRLAQPGSELWKRSAEVAENARFYYVMELYEKKKDNVAAARELKRFVETYPKSRNAGVALNNEIVIAEKAGQLDLVIAAARQLVREYPKSDDAVIKPAMLSLSSAYQRDARFAEAVEARLAFVDRYPQDSKAPDELATAALWKEALGDDAFALVLWRRYLEQYGGRPDAARVAFNVGLLHERGRDFRKVADHWLGFQREYARTAAPGQLLLARYKEGLALREVKKDDARVPLVLAEVVARFRALPEAEKLPAVVEAAAHARFLSTEAAFDEFIAIQFNDTRQRELVNVLKIKNARLAKLLDGYTDVIRFGSPAASEAALTRLGEAYRNFNKALLEAPMPRGLDPEQQELYRSTLENQALPLEDKAVEAFRKALETGSNFGVYTEWTLRAQELLRDYQPEAFSEVHRPAAVPSEPDLSALPEGVQAAAPEAPNEPAQAGSGGGAP